MNYGDLVPLPKLVSCIHCMYNVCCMCMSVWYPCMYFFIIIVYHFLHFLHVRLMIFNCVLAVISVQ